VTREENIRKDVQEIGWESMDSIDLAQVRNKWRADVNVVMNFGFHKMREIS